jgi:hypothetical protein
LPVRNLHEQIGFAPAEEDRQDKADQILIPDPATVPNEMHERFGMQVVRVLAIDDRKSGTKGARRQAKDCVDLILNRPGPDQRFLVLVNC